MSALLLKARPVASQLRDRLRRPYPDGLELYLDAADLRDADAMRASVANLKALDLPTGFVLLIEGPVRSLDGEFFDLNRRAEADREVIRRLAVLARELGARAVNVHVISPSTEVSRLNECERRAGLSRSLDTLNFFAEQMTAVGAIPTVENMPPVLRMREAGFYYSPIGMAAEDLRWLCEHVAGLRATLDISHAGLYVNCQRYARGLEAPPPEEGSCPELSAFVLGLPPVADVLEYAEVLDDSLVTCHVANARGLLGEGAPYDDGDLDLDRLVAALAPRTDYFVTETLEANPDRADEMRRALAAMRNVVRARV